MTPESSSSDRWLPPKEAKLRAWRMARGEDLESALTAAERLLRLGGEDRRHQQNKQLALASVVIASVISLASVILAVSRSLDVLLLPALVGIFGFAGVVIMTLLILLNRLKSNRSSEHQIDTANHIAALVEEVYLEVSDREEWSQLRLAAVKARLSVFSLHERGGQGLRDIIRHTRG